LESRKLGKEKRDTVNFVNQFQQKIIAIFDEFLIAIFLTPFLFTVSHIFVIALITKTK